MSADTIFPFPRFLIPLYTLREISLNEWSLRSLALIRLTESTVINEVVNRLDLQHKSKKNSHEKIT